MPVSLVKSALFWLKSCMSRIASMNSPPVSVKSRFVMFQQRKVTADHSRLHETYFKSNYTRLRIQHSSYPSPGPYSETEMTHTIMFNWTWPETKTQFEIKIIKLIIINFICKYALSQLALPVQFFMNHICPTSHDFWNSCRLLLHLLFQIKTYRADIDDV
jgi:hypothetical protein